jgi:hypothetical protein
MSRRDNEIETEAARQAHYIKWGLIMGILDPCGHKRGYQRIVAIYVGYLMTGVNFRNKDSLRSNTVKGYATGINSLFTLQSMEAPIVLSDPNNWWASSSTTSSRKRILRGSQDASKVERILFARFGTAHLIRRHHHWSLPWSSRERMCSNYRQKCGLPCVPFWEAGDQSVHCKRLSIYQCKWSMITELSDASIEVVDRVRITWRIQKNCQNNQKIPLPCDKTNPTICLVLAALRLVLRACPLSQPDSMPVVCYLKKDAMTYITGSRIVFHFRAAAKAVRPIISKDDEERYSAHLMRVWACVLSDEAGKSPDYIKKCLRWMGDSF